MKSIAILTGGGPAPGMNTVVASVAKTFLRDGYRVIGLHGGYSALFTDKPRMQDLDFLTADEIFNKGGSILKMSRFYDFIFIPVLHRLKTHTYWQRWGATEFYRDSDCVYYQLKMAQ